MKTAHRKAAKHKRKWQKDPAAMGRVFARTQPYTQAEQAHLAIPAYDSLNRITSGQGEPKNKNAHIQINPNQKTFNRQIKEK